MGTPARIRVVRNVREFNVMLSVCLHRDIPYAQTQTQENTVLQKGTKLFQYEEAMAFARVQEKHAFTAATVPWKSRHLQQINTARVQRR